MCDCKWRDIETAPKDRTRILVPYPIYGDAKSATPTAYHVIIVYWNDVGWDNGGWMLHEDVTHWMPLPEAPVTPEKPNEIRRQP